ncbi:MAG: protein kinase, partial [Myxococcota bacterium]
MVYRRLMEQFGSYSLLEQIGIGGMAEVFLARHSGVEGFEKELVIKRIRPHLSEVPSFVNMFLGEAKLAAQLSHPNIVAIYDLGKIAASYFIAMEYIAGKDLSAIIPRAKK